MQANPAKQNNLRLLTGLACAMQPRPGNELPLGIGL